MGKLLERESLKASLKDHHQDSISRHKIVPGQFPALLVQLLSSERAPGNPVILRAVSAVGVSVVSLMS